MLHEKISETRSQLNQLLKDARYLSFKCTYPDRLIKGTPAMVYRRCGKKNCQCHQAKQHRHGPYRVLQIYRDGKQQQIMLNARQQAQWQQAKNYQYQRNTLKALRLCLQEIETQVKTMIDCRIEEWPSCL